MRGIPSRGVIGTKWVRGVASSILQGLARQNRKCFRETTVEHIPGALDMSDRPTWCPESYDIRTQMP